MTQISRDRTWIFTVALISKIIFASIFFGSVDFIVSLGQATDVIAGKPFSVPYFPVISAYLWLSALLAAYTPLPLGLCFKVIPALASSLSAVLIYDILRRAFPDRAFASGMLFALSPVTLIVDCLHFQWDSVVLFLLLLSFYVRDFFSPSYKNFFISGALFALSFLVKPYVLMFGLFAAAQLRGFPGGFVEWIKRHLVWSSGFLCIGILGLFALHLIGYNILERWHFINEYGNGGIVIFGLPKTGILSDFPFLQNRMSVLMIMALLVVPYHLRWLGIFEAVGISFTLCLTFLGLAPQYLGWSIPFLLLSGSYVGVSVYSLVAGIFLALYYAHPEASFMHHENMATFAPLKSFSWLTPTDLFWDPNLLGGIQTVGNYLVPLFAFVSLVLLVAQVIVSRGSRGMNNYRENSNVLPLSWLGWAFGPFALAVLTRLALSINSVGVEYGREVAEKSGWYAMEPYQPNPYFHLSVPSQGSAFNVVNILIFFSSAWFLCCLGRSKIFTKVDAEAQKC